MRRSESEFCADRCVDRLRRPAATLATLAVAGAWLFSACGDGTTDPDPPDQMNRAPAATGTIPVQTVHVGDDVTVNLSGYFSDPDGDALTYSAQTSNGGVARVSVSGSNAVVSGVGQGDATILVTATDPDGLSAQQSFSVNVPNRAPETAGNISDMDLFTGETAEVDVSAYFDDPDGDELAYSAQTSDAGVASVSVSGTKLVVSAVAKGDATITATATDPDGLSVQQSFAVRVPNRAPEAAGSISDRDLFAGDTAVIVVTGYFNDADGDALTFEAATSDAGVATTTVVGETVTVFAVSEGSAALTVIASDPEGLSAEQSFSANVAPRGDPSIQFVTVSAAVPEGGRIVVELEARPSPESALTVGYTIGGDEDSRTDDANQADHDGGGGGVVRFEAGDRQATLEITVHDDDDIEPTREVFAISLETPGEGAGYVLGPSATATVSIEEGICDRTPRVRDALITLTGVDRCHETDRSHLAGIATLDLRGPEPEESEAVTLDRSSAGANDGRCGASTELASRTALDHPTMNPWSCAPRTLERAPVPPALFSRGDGSGEPITELRAGDFLELTELKQLWLMDNKLKELPAGLFSGLEELRGIDFRHNRIRELPTGLLAGLSRLESFIMHKNELVRLPPDLFSGLTRLREVWLSSNELVEVPSGLVSDAVNLEEFALSGNRLASLPTGVFSGLAYLRVLYVSGNRLTELDGAAFSDLTDLESLALDENRLAELQSGIFANLGNLENLWIGKNRLETLQSGLFDELTNLRTLAADSNRIEDFEDGLFASLSELESLFLSNNRLSELRSGMFSGLEALKELTLGGNQFAAVEPGVFAGLANLERLWLDQGELTQLRAGAFNGLSRLTFLGLWENQLSTLTDGVFMGLPALEELWIYENEIEEISETVFAEAPLLEMLVMWHNRLTGLPPNVFASQNKLEELYLGGNAIAQLPAGVFSNLAELDTLTVDTNNLSELPGGLFEGLFELDRFNAVANPGAPFSLKVRLERRDTTDLAAPGPAKVVLSLAEGAPFSMRIPLSVDGGALSADTAVIMQGHTASAEFTVTMSSGSQSGTEVVAGPAPPIPDGILGVEVVAADTLVLFTTSGDVSGAAAPDMSAQADGRVPKRDGAAPVVLVGGLPGSAGWRFRALQRRKPLRRPGGLSGAPAHAQRGVAGVSGGRIVPTSG